jgi:glycosyltransferase involved in cell wall biosynthesis
VRIALVNGTHGWGGGERWFLEAATGLAERGHDVLLCAAPGDVLERRAVEAGTPVGPLSAIDAEVAVLNSRRDLAAVLRAFGGRPPSALVLRRGIDRPLHDGLLRRKAWKRLAAILANSRATAETVRRSLPWFPADRIRVIPNPVALPAPPPVAPPAAAPRIGSAGRLVRQKGFDVLLRALALVADVPWTASIAGDGKLRRRLERLTAALRLETRVTFVGHLDRLDGFYAATDLLVVPSRYEGFCYVAAEAALAGICVVASDVSSLREVVRDGETGLLVVPEDPRSFATAIRGLLSDPDHRAALGRRAKEEAEHRFRPGPIHDELAAFLACAAGLDPVGGKE